MTPPDVSVVIPVYNSVSYVDDAIQSVVDQTIAATRVEILVVDDGSTDGSGAVIAQRAAVDSRIRVITQKNSGTPGGARNPALDIACGAFVFFLDSDDLLAPEALEAMVDVAIAEESDVVLGKIASSDHRPVPSSMFKRTNLDADLVKDRVFNTLGPTKLIRRDIIERLRLRFPTDQTVGEDEPFMAAVYLNARKISVLADRDYYIVQYRHDGGNMTLTKRNSASHALVAQRVASVIETYTEPGDFRDGLLRRPFDRPLARALDPRWLKMSETEQTALAADLRSTIGHLYTDGLRRLLRAETQIKLDLLTAGELDALATYIAFLNDGVEKPILWENGDFRMRLPETVSALTDPSLRVVPAPPITCRLEDVSVNGKAVTVSASVTIPLLAAEPDAIFVRARLRGAHDVLDFTETSRDSGSTTAPFFVVATGVEMPRGIWDLFVVVRFGDEETERRLGADRSRTIEPDGVSNADDAPEAKDRVLAYFTQGRGNLSVDCGAILHKQFALARVAGLTLDEDGRGIVLVETTRAPQPADEYFCYVDGVPQHGGRRLLPATQLGERLVGLRLPEAAEVDGATLTITALLGGVKTSLPITATDYWNARAAGFELSPGKAGRVTVVLDEKTRAAQRKRSRTVQWHRLRSSRAAQAVRRTPVLGRAADRIARGTWRRAS
ncbi:glycosyltransferase family 2 protein [Brachybacterium alimentarium]|uniref:glycosyltransferase family 2 protein n=1 Tax=Brachybacterium alimentarium TaxID=47845 RepID=UPI003FD39D0E